MSIRDGLDPEMIRPWQENTLNFEFESPTISLPECKERKQISLNHFFQNQNRSLFVRDLPFHTTAEVLREFIEKKLNHPDCVEDALIRFSQQGKTLQVGCVLLRSESIIADALEKLHGCRFCGRDLRVTVYNNKAPIEDSQNAAVQFSFLANDAQIPLVTEEVVRSHMEELYGPLRDVCIRFHRYSEIGIQSGYGFLSFINESDNDRAVEQVQKKVVHNLQYDCRWSSKCKPVSAPGTLRNKRLIHLASATPTYGPESLSTISHIPETTVAASLEFSHIESLSKMEAASLTRIHPLHPSPVHRSNPVPNSAASLLSKDPLRHDPEESIRHVNLSAPPKSNYLSYEQSRHPPLPPRDYSLARDEFFRRHYHRDDPSFVNSNLEHRYSAAHHHYDPPRPHDFQHHNVDQDRYFYQTPGGIYDRHLPARGYPLIYDKYERERYLLDRYVPERHPSERFPERYALDRPLNERYPADPRTAFSCYRDMHPHHPQYAPGRGEDGQFPPRSSTGSHSMYRDNPRDIEVIVPDDHYFMGASARDNRRSVHDNADPRRGLEGRLMENMHRPMQHLPLPSHGSTRGSGPASSSALSSLPSRFGPRSSIYEPHDHRDMELGAGSANVGPLRNTAPSRPFVSAASHAQTRPPQMHPTQLLPARQLTDEMSMNTSTASLSASSQPSLSNRSMASSDAMANMFSYSFGRKNEEDGLPAPASSSSLSHSSSFTFDETAHPSYLLSQFQAPSASEALPAQSILDTNVGESMVTSLVTAESEDLNTSASVDNSVLAVLLKDVPSTS